MIKIALASDHAGYTLRQYVAGHLKSKGVDIIEYGAVQEEKPESYVPAGQAASKAVLDGKAERAIVFCGTGLGISIVCNKHKGIRCALCTNEYMARMARVHNDANVLALGGRVIGKALAISIVDAFFDGEFESGGRHQMRVTEIAKHEDHEFS